MIGEPPKNPFGGTRGSLSGMGVSVPRDPAAWAWVVVSVALAAGALVWVWLGDWRWLITAAVTSLVVLFIGGILTTPRGK